MFCLNCGVNDGAESGKGRDPVNCLRELFRGVMIKKGFFSISLFVIGRFLLRFQPFYLLQHECRFALGGRFAVRLVFGIKQLPADALGKNGIVQFFQRLFLVAAVQYRGKFTEIFLLKHLEIVFFQIIVSFDFCRQSHQLLQCVVVKRTAEFIEQVRNVFELARCHIILFLSDS